jgi:hypothetical protein
VLQSLLKIAKQKKRKDFTSISLMKLLLPS